jgi:hypothetical protein
MVETLSVMKVHLNGDAETASKQLLGSSEA